MKESLEKVLLYLKTIPVKEKDLSVEIFEFKEEGKSKPLSLLFDVNFTVERDMCIRHLVCEMDKINAENEVGIKITYKPYKGEINLNWSV